ncbi:MAG TPA: ABC transporter permease [Gaiellaceae bacterium]|nr:ABC transporter permease [Gaiellaceae bacterium]
MRYLLRRFAVLVLTLWVAVTVNFALPRLMPGNPVQTKLAKIPGISPLARRALEKQFGLDTHQSVVGQYFSYLRQTLSGNLGRSFTYYPSTVSSMIRQSLPWTLGMVGFATLLAFVLGCGLGIVAAWRRGAAGGNRNARLDTFLVPLGVMFGATPPFWLGTLLVYFVAFKLGWFPIGGSRTPGGPAGLGGTLDVLKHAVLPAFTLTFVSLGGWVLLMRNSMLTVMNDDYVKFARAKGLSNRTIAYRYAARNAILPIFTQLALALGIVVGGQVFIEIVFSYQGIGYWLLQAVLNEDYPLMQGIFLIITVTLLVANFLADALYVLVDPRVRVEAGT